MLKPTYHAPSTFLFYAIAGILFGTYGGRVCPMLETLTGTEVLIHTGITFAMLFAVRHIVSVRQHYLGLNSLAALDTRLFTVFGLPLAIYYNTRYDFPIDSNLKVVLGMTMFGFLTGFILELRSRLEQFDQVETININSTERFGQRESMVKRAIGLVLLLLITLTLALTLVAWKDVYWLEHNPARVLDGSGKISVIKEILYVAAVLIGYSVYLMLLWSRLMKRVLVSHEESLKRVTSGAISQRLTVYSNDELGSVASMTNKMLDSLENSQQEVNVTRDVAIVSLSALAESRDNETGAHILRTQEYVKVLAEQLAAQEPYRNQLTPEYIDLLYKSAPLHDVGKVGVPDSVLLKPGKLTDEEFEVMKQHPQIGADALSTAEKQLGSSSFLRVAKEISLTHHEKWDGSGYPNRLAGDAIPLSGRLMALADVYDALISKRIYKPAFSHEKAKSIIIEGRGSHFDPAIVAAFEAVEADFVDIAARYKDKAQALHSA